MQLGEQGDRLDDVLAVRQRRQPLAGELRADHLVVVEGDPPAGLVPPGAGLADVVQQRGQPQHQVRAVLLEPDRPLEHLQGVLVDVLVLVVLVDLEPQGGQLGQHLGGQAGVDQQLQAAARVRAEQQLGQLLLDPLAATRSPAGRPSPSSPRARPGRRRSRAGWRTGPPAASAAGRRRRSPPGCRGVRSSPASRSSRPPNGSTNPSGAAQPGSATAIALTVRSRRRRSSTSESPNATAGLREPGSYASAR